MGIPQGDEGVSAPPEDLGECRIEIAGASYAHDLEHDAQAVGGDLGAPDLARLARGGGVPEQRHPNGPRRRLLQELEPLSARLLGLEAESGDGPAGAREALDEARANRVRAGRHHDRDPGRRLPGGLRGPIADGHEHVGSEAYQLRRVFG